MASPADHPRSARHRALWSWWLLSLAWCALDASGQTFAEQMQRGLQEESRSDPIQALVHYRRALALRPDSADASYRVAKQLFDQTFLTRDDEEVRRLAEEALPFAERALEQEETAPHLIGVAVLYGELALYGNNRTKVDYARRIRRYAERALKLDPDYAWAHHVLGRWHVEISKLGFAKRMVASLLYGGLPRGKLSTGIAHLQRAIELEPAMAAHLVELGFAYRADDHDNLALQCWNEALENKSNAIYDRAARSRARSGLRRLARDEKEKS